jgi:hypothetical protein
MFNTTTLVDGEIGCTLVAVFLEPFCSFFSSSTSFAESKIAWPAQVQRRWLRTDRHAKVTQMKRTGPVSSLGREYDDFLLAPIGDDHNGMQLSVLSALARLDVDPWDEAAALALLPADAATRKLAAMIAALPAGPSARPDAATIAARLIPLLPRRVGAGVAPRPTLAGVGTVTRSPILTYLVLYAVFMLFMLVYQWLVATPPPPAQLNAAPEPPSRIISPQASAPPKPASLSDRH